VKPNVATQQSVCIGATAFAKVWRRAGGQTGTLSCHYDTGPCKGLKSVSFRLAKFRVLRGSLQLYKLALISRSFSAQDF
jgi:hypothetical protein